MELATALRARLRLHAPHLAIELTVTQVDRLDALDQLLLGAAGLLLDDLPHRFRDEEQALDLLTQEEHFGLRIEGMALAVERRTVGAVRRIVTST